MKELEFEIKRYNDGHDKLVICFDSTGVSILSVSGWHQRKHGGKKLGANGRWGKIHIMMDLNSNKLLATIQERKPILFRKDEGCCPDARIRIA